MKHQWPMWPNLAVVVLCSFAAGVTLAINDPFGFVLNVFAVVANLFAIAARKEWTTQ
jgi:hypothetical protein